MEQSNSWLTSVPDSGNQWDVSNVLIRSRSVSHFFFYLFAIFCRLLILPPPPSTPLFILSSFFITLFTFPPPLLHFPHLSFTQSSQTITRKLQMQSFSRAMLSSFKLANSGLVHMCARQYTHLILSSGASSCCCDLNTDQMIDMSARIFFFGQFPPLGNPYFNHID